MVVVAPSSSPPLLRAVVFLPVGIVLLVAAALTAQGAVRFLVASETAPGVVTRLLAGGSHPEIAFTTQEGRRVVYPQGGLVGGYRPGRVVRVRYLAAHPEQSACVDRWPAVWTWPIMLLTLGATFTYGGAVALRERTAALTAPVMAEPPPRHLWKNP